MTLKSKRKARKEIDKDELDFSKPIDITQFGGPDDCFGELHDATHEVCRVCGDSELCLLIKGQKAHAKRGTIEKTQPFKDLEPPTHPDLNIETATKYIKVKHKKGTYTKKKILRLAAKKFNPYVSNFDLETIYNKQHGKT